MRLKIVKWLVKTMKDKTEFIGWVKMEFPGLGARRAHYLDRLDKALQAQVQQAGL